MTKEEFVSKLPHLEEFKGISAEDVQVALLRASGFLEACEGMKANPELAARMNQNELRLLQTMVKLVFTLQYRNLVLAEEIAGTPDVQSRISELTSLLDNAVLERNKFEDELNAVKKRKNRV
jgi:hypothetical protein